MTKLETKGKSRMLGRALDIGMTETSTAGTPIYRREPRRHVIRFESTGDSRHVGRCRVTYESKGHVPDIGVLRDELKTKTDGSNNGLDLNPKGDWNVKPVVDLRIGQIRRKKMQNDWSAERGWMRHSRTKLMKQRTPRKNSMSK